MGLSGNQTREQKALAILILLRAVEERTWNWSQRSGFLASLNMAEGETAKVGWGGAGTPTSDSLCLLFLLSSAKAQVSTNHGTWIITSKASDQISEASVENWTGRKKASSQREFLFLYWAASFHCPSTLQAAWCYLGCSFVGWLDGLEG